MSSALHFVYKYIWYIMYTFFFFSHHRHCRLFCFSSSFLVQCLSFGTFRSLAYLLFALVPDAHSFIYLQCELCCAVYFMYACDALKFILVNFFPDHLPLFLCAHVLACLLRTCVLCILSFHTPVGIVDKIITNIDICF